MNRFFLFFMFSFFIHILVGAVLLSKVGNGFVQSTDNKNSDVGKTVNVNLPFLVVDSNSLKKPTRVKKLTYPKKKTQIKTPVTKIITTSSKVKVVQPLKLAQVKIKKLAQVKIKPDKGEVVEQKLPEDKDPENKLNQKKVNPATIGNSDGNSDIKIESVPVPVSAMKPYTQMKQQNNNVAPGYPIQALKNKWEGKVQIIYYVNKEGMVEKIQLQESSGYSILDNTAIRALSRYRYHSGQAGWVQHQVEFFINQDKEIKKIISLGK